MEKIDPQKITAYWKKTAKHDYETMLALFKIKRYSETLFFGHLVLEKILKANVVKHTGGHAPYTHNLVHLFNNSGSELSMEEIRFLGEMNDYNLRTRYPDYKLKIYKLCTKEYTKNRMDKVINIYRKL